MLAIIKPMTKNSDVDSIIKMLRDENKPIGLTGGHEGDGLPFAVEAPQDRTTMVVVLGILAGLVLGALFYYCVMYMPTEQASAAACESSLIKEPSISKEPAKSATTAPKRIKSNAAGASLRAAPKKSVKLNAAKSDSLQPKLETPEELDTPGTPGTPAAPATPRNFQCRR